MFTDFTGETTRFLRGESLQGGAPKIAKLVYNSNVTMVYRRKFRSQTSDNMDRWKSRWGKSKRRERNKKEDQRGESQTKEDAGARKGRKVAKHCVRVEKARLPCAVPVVSV